MIPRMGGGPFLHFRMLVCTLIVQDQMDWLATRRRTLDSHQEPEEFGMAVTPPALSDDRPVQPIERCKQTGCTVPNTVMRLPSLGLRLPRDVLPWTSLPR